MSPLLWPSLTMMIGLGLIAAEVFLPTAGLLGWLAIAFLGLALHLAFSDSVGLGYRFLAAGSVLVPATMAGSIYALSRSVVGRRAFLRPPEAGDLGVSHAGPAPDGLVGRPGWTLTPLRPSGKVDFDGRRLDGVSEGGMIDRGVPVVAVRVRSGRVIVRDASEETPGQSAP